MKKLGIASLIASALTAGLLSLAGPARAEIGHHDGVNVVSRPSVYVPQVKRVYVPHVDSAVRH